MSNFVAISGPSSTGKTSLVDALSTHHELSNAVFVPDLYNKVWGDLVEQGYFHDYSEIIKDSDYVCVYLIKLVDYYTSIIDQYEETNKLVIFDCCWLDLSVYALLNMWSSHVIKELQEEILLRINKLDNTVSKIYLTSEDLSKKVKIPFRDEFKVYSVKSNRPLELQYYNMVRNLKYVDVLPSSDISDSSLYIIKDLKNLGYV